MPNSGSALRRVLVIGGGMAGKTAAICLRRQGILSGRTRATQFPNAPQPACTGQAAYRVVKETLAALMSEP